MEDFNPGDQLSIARFVLEHLPRHKQFTLATTDAHNWPWAVCLNLLIDNHMNVIWQSRHDTEHSRHVRAKAEVAICIASETEPLGDFGFSARALAYEVTDKSELAQLLQLRARQKNQPPPPLDDYIDPAPYRIYKAILQEAWINDDRHIKTRIDLQVLRKQAKAI